MEKVRTGLLLHCWEETFPVYKLWKVFRVSHELKESKRFPEAAAFRNPGVPFNLCDIFVLLWYNKMSKCIFREQTMRLSIIVPVYNMAADGKLNFCLDSLINQTVTDYEIIAVDDCSTDNSLDILREYEKNYPDKFRAIHSPVNKRQGGAKNIGIREAKGEWIGFIDSDDWIVPEFYERLLTRAEETGADIVGCDYSLVDHHTYEVGIVEHNHLADQSGVLDHEKRRRLILDPGSLVINIYKRQFILENELFFPENIFYEDNAVGKSYMILNKHFEYIDEPLYFYYQHGNSTVHTISERRCQDRVDAAKIMIDQAKKFGYYDEFYSELEYSFTLLHYINTLFTYMVGVRPVKYSFVENLGREVRAFFPDFQKNPYYIERTHPEEKKLIAMQQKSTLQFIIYYKLLWAYRNFRKKLKK